MMENTYSSNKVAGRAVWWVLIVLILLPIYLPVNSSAQYFGRNKIQYQSFNFKTLETEHYKIYYYPEELEATTDGGRMAERWYERYARLFNHELEPGQPIIFYANQADFEQTNVISGLISQGTGGVTEGLKDRVVIPFTGDYQQNNHVIGHELVHAFQYSIMKKGSRQVFSQRQMPLWFIEGMAEYLSIGRDDPLTAMWLRDAVLNDDVPSFDQMSRNAKYFPYRWGQAFWAWITGMKGDAVVPELFRAVQRANWDKAFQHVMSQSPDSLSDQWRKAVIDEYKPQLEGRTKPDEVGKKLMTGKHAFNMSPSISPDGKYMAVISQKDVFTLDLFLVDAQTGKIIDKLVSSNTDSHFDALRFINSAGTWSPDGRKLAFVVFKDGNNAIAFMDVKSRKIERTVVPNDMDAMMNLAWSPDGRYVAISGSHGGIGNLYLYDTHDQSFRQLTNDRYSQMEPAWSPDGRTLAYVTDQVPGTNFDSLTFARVKIALLDVESGHASLINLADSAKMINPQYSPDGHSLYFISDPDGFSDLYRYSFDDSLFYRITTIATGVSGLTELSPAMSVAAKTGRMVFTVFDNTNYDVLSLDSSETNGTPVTPGAQVVDIGGFLPYANEETSVTEYLRQPEAGLVSGKSFKIKKYNPSLSLDYIGHTGIGLAVDRFGTSLGGGVAFLFSDMLGNRVLGLDAFINGTLKDIGGSAFYLNQSHRLNWGVSAGHIPYQTLDFYTEPDTATVGGTTYAATTTNLIRQRVYLDAASFISSYPFSTNRRLEFATGFTHVGYSNEIESITDVSGLVVRDNKESIPAPSGLYLSQTSLAYVGDYSFFGFTSPVKGRRYRFEAEPSFGTLTYTSFLFDYRQYIYADPVTFAFRLYHYGRYFKGSDDDRLSQLFLGWETLVRGYPDGSISLNECTTSGDSTSCPVFDRLVGSRLAVVNLEIRLPLLGTDQFGLINFPYLPTELLAFVDGGVAWSRGETITWKLTERSNKRIPVFSAGVASRFNILGILVTQVYMAFPFQRPDKTTQWGFVIAPGW
ncbi:MAG: peptidase S9 [Candidatus Zixiibacteriota bacterium]|jgi:Tol biopolymer transport system component